MKKALLVASVMLSSVAFAGEPYYLIVHGIVDSTVIAIYGWSDNKTPCITLEKYMNKAMEEENNFHRFSCANATTALPIDCESEKEPGSGCNTRWQTRNDLLRRLMPK